MLDLEHENPITFAEAARLVPPHGRHVSIIHRWAMIGLRGVKLEWAQAGGTRVTTKEALMRFFAQLSGGETPCVPRRRAAANAARRELEHAGFTVGPESITEI